MSDKRGTNKKRNPAWETQTFEETAATEAAAKIVARLGPAPSLGLILGSGFQCLLRGVIKQAEMPLRDIPGFPKLGVQGHLPVLLCGELEHVRLWVCGGRAHYYEGYSMAETTWPVRVLGACGIQHLVLTNAAGGINRQFKPGDFMLVTDHINMMGENPLRGIVPPDARRFVDLGETYSGELNRLFFEAARQSNMRIHKGVYIGVCGPTYETPAEIRAFKRLGADAVGMSCIPEAVTGRYCGLEIAALSCITNAAAGLSKEKLSHEHVLETARRANEQAIRLFSAFAGEYARWNTVKTGSKGPP